MSDYETEAQGMSLAELHNHHSVFMNRMTGQHPGLPAMTPHEQEEARKMNAAICGVIASREAPPVMATKSPEEFAQDIESIDPDQAQRIRDSIDHVAGEQSTMDRLAAKNKRDVDQASAAARKATGRPSASDLDGLRAVVADAPAGAHRDALQRRLQSDTEVLSKWEMEQRGET